MKALVVGAGSIGLRHIGNLRALGVEQVAVFDADPAACARAAGRGGVAVGSLAAGLDASPDIVLVCTPTHLHLGVARAALAADAHLFIEKPIASRDDQEIEDFLALARSSGRTVLVGCNMRFHPGVAALKAALDAGRIAKPRIFRAWFSHYLPNWRPGADYRKTYSASSAQGGGIILEAVHEIDYLGWLAGPMVSLDAFTAHVSDLEIDGEDTAVLCARFASGAAGVVSLDYVRPAKTRGCEITGTDGVVTWSSEAKAPERISVRHYDAARGRWADLFQAEDFDANQMYLSELRHFLACVRGEEQPLLDAFSAARVLKLALRARDRARQGLPLRG